jgi:hypothetical protein
MVHPGREAGQEGMDYQEQESILGIMDLLIILTVLRLSQIPSYAEVQQIT